MASDITEQTLSELLLILDTPKTARQIASACKCSKPTAYNRLQALRARLKPAGIKVQFTRRQEGRTGPRARAFFVAL